MLWRFRQRRCILEDVNRPDPYAIAARILNQAEDRLRGESQGDHPGIRLMTVDLHHESEAWWARSDDLPGWSAAGESYDEMRGLLDEAARLYGWHGWYGVTPEEVVGS